MADEVIVLDHEHSPPANRVRIALKEKGVAFVSKQEDLPNKKSSLLLEMNPVHKQIPVLIHNGKPVCESLIIVEYIDEVWNDKSPLLPTDPYERAHSKFWADYIDKKIYTSGRPVLTTKGETQAAAMKELISSLKILDAELGDKPYFGGKTFGITDIAFIPFYSRFYTLEKFGNLSMNEECPKLVAWGERCLQRESVSTTMRNQYETYDFMLEIRKKLGVE
ncbi:glutathione S-transferase U25-like [Coffea arabica]|uniref:Glutathione S-transferase n=1 Tax=Coffea arabica TaxID=13443 RepID=A0A6P6SEG2_COFAR|nr:glutathione S-transferase U25-like [Coffea arabica]